MADEWQFLPLDPPVDLAAGERAEIKYTIVEGVAVVEEVKREDSKP